MSVTITSQPTSPRYSIGDLVYSVTSTLVGPTIAIADQPREFSVVIDILEGSTRVARFFKQPNPVGVCTFNIGRALNDLLEYDVNALGADNDVPAILGSQTFDIRFGERYIDGNGDLTIFNGTGARNIGVGDPSVAANDLTVVKGVSEHNGVDLTAADNITGILSLEGVDDITLPAGSPIIVSYYNTSSRTIIHEIPNILPQFTSTQITRDGRTININFDQDTNILGNRTFYWFNRRGEIDYWNANKGGRSNVTVNRSTFQGNPITYGTSIPSITNGLNNSVYNKGETVYGIDFDETYTATFDFTNQAASKLLEGLHTSPEVYIYENDSFVPVIIQSNYDRYPIERNQGNFNYEIQYRYSNKLRSV